MKYCAKNVNGIINLIDQAKFIEQCRINPKDFTRKRKATPKDIILYELNKRGLSSKMEIINFNNINDVKDISSPGLFKQREKLNPEAFIYLMQESLKMFYKEYKKEVKTYKGYVLIGIDGGDFEIPNTKKSRTKYNGKQQNQCARVTVSTCFDLLNQYTLDVIVNSYDYDELQMSKEHLNTIKSNKLTGGFNTIRIMDRNYKSLSHMYHDNKNNNKFLIRIASNIYIEKKLKK